MPFLLRLDIRHQDEGWAPAPYVQVQDKSFDLTFEFAHVTEENVSEIARSRWESPTVDTIKHTIGNDTCHARLLTKCLMASMSHDLSFTLINRLPHNLCNDGTYLLWALTNNVYQNNVAFVEQIQEKISTVTLQQHSNNVEKYLIFVKQHLHMITLKTSSGAPG
jgi:hypothetical protein